MRIKDRNGRLVELVPMNNKKLAHAHYCDTGEKLTEDELSLIEETFPHLVHKAWWESVKQHIPGGDNGTEEQD